MRDTDGRPRAWGVLAVALALMALLVALFSAGGRGQRSSSASSKAERSGHAASIEHPRAASDPPSAARTTIRSGSYFAAMLRIHAGRPSREVPGGSSPRQTATPLEPVADLVGTLGFPPTSGEGSPSGARASVPGSSTPAPRAQASATGPAGSSGTGSGGAPGAGTSSKRPTASPPPAASPTEYPGPGLISAPATAATYEAVGGGPVTAVATWSGASVLELSIACPGGVSTSRTGGPGLSVEVDDTGRSGQCEVSLSLPPAVREDVAFTLSIEPAP